MDEKTIRQSESNVAAVKAYVEGKFKAALEKAKAKVRPEVTTPQGEWFLWVYGVQLIAQPGNPIAPQKMVKAGDTFYVTTLVWFNPLGSPSPCNTITNLAKSIDITYHTANLDAWDIGPKDMNTTHVIPMVSGQCFYTDVLELTAQEDWAACYEMNICARIMGCQPGSRPPYAGFATAVADFDPDYYPWLWPWLTPYPGVAPRWEFDIPLRFMIYP